MPKVKPADGALLRVRVTPRSSRNEVGPMEGEILKVRLTAPPVDDKANRALVELVAERLDVPRAAVEVLSGARSRNKTLRIQGLTTDELARRFRPL